VLKNAKKMTYLFFGSIFELGALPCIVCILVCCRFFARKRSLFIGMMHVNNWTYVAEAMRQRGYYVQVVPWIIPLHEVDVIPYDINLKRKYPLLYSQFIGQYLLSFYLFLWALFRFDVFMMPFRGRLLDRTVWLQWLEIPLLHLAKKTVILNTYGGDVATPRLLRKKELKYSLYDGYIADPQYRLYNEKAIARNTRILEKQADCIISAIDHVDYLQRIDAYFHLRCIDTDNILPHYVVDNRVPVFVHAPNHRLIKGTDSIIAAIESLNQEGCLCELKIVEHAPHSQLLDIIRGSDAVIDQLLLGAYARLAIEAMALGKPVFCYLRPDLFSSNPIWAACPVINVNPDTIKRVLKNFLQQPRADWVACGERGRHYVKSYHSFDYIGQRFDRIIQKVQACETR
jgi:hypothetical protein